MSLPPSNEPSHQSKVGSLSSEDPTPPSAAPFIQAVLNQKDNYLAQEPQASPCRLPSTLSRMFQQATHLDYGRFARQNNLEPHKTIASSRANPRAGAHKPPHANSLPSTTHDSTTTTELWLLNSMENHTISGRCRDS